MISCRPPQQCSASKSPEQPKQRQQQQSCEPCRRDRSENADLEAAVSAKGEELLSLAAKLLQKEEDIVALQQRCEEMDAGLAHVEALACVVAEKPEAIEKLQTEVQDLKGEAADQKEVIKSQQALIEQLQAQLAASAQEMTAAAAPASQKAVAEVQQLREEVIQQKQRNEELVSERATLEAELKQAHELRDAVANKSRASAKTLTQKLRAAQMQIEQLKAESAVVQLSLAKKDQDLADLTAHVQSLSQSGSAGLQVEEVMSAKDSLERENEALREQLKKQKIDNGAIVQRYNLLKERIKHAQQNKLNSTRSILDDSIQNSAILTTPILDKQKPITPRRRGRPSTSSLKTPDLENIKQAELMTTPAGTTGHLDTSKLSPTMQSFLSESLRADAERTLSPIELLPNPTTPSALKTSTKASEISSGLQEPNSELLARLRALAASSTSKLSAAP